MRLTQKHLVYGGLAALTVVSAFILYIGYVGYSPINRQSVARIRPLMTEPQVEAILGGPCSRQFPMPERQVNGKLVVVRTLKLWQDDGGSCIVIFDAAGLVEGAHYQPPFDPGILGRLRAALRWRW